MCPLWNRWPRAKLEEWAVCRLPWLWLPCVAGEGPVSKNQKLSHKTRLEILRLTDAGLKPEEISRKLFVPIAAVFRAQSWRKHVESHQHAKRNLELQLQEHVAEQSTAQRGKGSGLG